MGEHPYLMPVGTGPSTGWAHEFLVWYKKVLSVVREMLEKKLANYDVTPEWVVCGSQVGTITTGEDAEISLSLYTFNIQFDLMEEVPHG